MIFDRYISRKQEIIENTDPQRIYVENVRNFFNIPSPLAKLFCEMAVKEQFFAKKKGIICPNPGCGRIIEIEDSKEDQDSDIKCDTCEALEKDQFIFNKSDLKRIVFYQLLKE